jgi:ribosomal-protein-alanine N-acetyltransferase
MNDLGTEVVVRPGQSADLTAVVELENRCFSDPWTPATLLGELVADDLRLPLVVECDGRLRGYLMAWRVVDQMHILNIATDPAFHRRGLGTTLLREAARQAARLQLAEFTLEVRRSNTPARAFYTRHGFDETGVRPGYYADNGEDAIIMTCAVATVLRGE